MIRLVYNKKYEAGCVIVNSPIMSKEIVMWWLAPIMVLLKVNISDSAGLDYSSLQGALYRNVVNHNLQDIKRVASRQIDEQRQVCCS